MLKRKILLAEDDEDDQRFFHDFVQHREDVELISIVENGVLLIDHLGSIHDAAGLPDLIILDQNMPKKNGLQTLKYLKEDQRFHHIPVVIYSTYTDENLVKDGSENGACLVLSKPVSEEGYNQMLERLLDACV